MEKQPEKNLEGLGLAKHIENLELALMQPEIRRSREKIDELLADDFIEFGMFGKRYTKQDFLEILPNSEKEQFERYTASNFKAQKIAEDTVLLTFRATIEFLKTNEKILTLRSSIWQRRGDKWQMVFHQGTVVKDAGNNNA